METWPILMVHQQVHPPFLHGGHGFVVLKHPTTMSAQDWLSSSAAPTSVNVATEEEMAVRKIYAKETDEMKRKSASKKTQGEYENRETSPVRTPGRRKINETPIQF